MPLRVQRLRVIPSPSCNLLSPSNILCKLSNLTLNDRLWHCNYVSGNLMAIVEDFSPRHFQRPHHAITQPVTLASLCILQYHHFSYPTLDLKGVVWQKYQTNTKMDRAYSVYKILAKTWCQVLVSSFYT